MLTHHDEMLSERLGADIDQVLLRAVVLHFYGVTRARCFCSPRPRTERTKVVPEMDDVHIPVRSQALSRRGFDSSVLWSFF